MIAIGIDIGGQTIRAALVRDSGEIVAASKAQTPPDGAPQALTVVLRSLIDEFSAEAPLAAAAGVAIPGRLAADARTMLRSVNLPALDGIDVFALLTGAIGKPIIMRSDVSMAGYAVWKSLPAPRPARFVYLSLGTGVGGIAIIDGRLMDTLAGGPAQFGHLIVDTGVAARRCRCGAAGCLEAYASGPSIDQAPAASDAIARAAETLAIGLQQLSHLWAPDVIALGGGVIEHHPELVRQAEAAFAKRRGSLTPPAMAICASPLQSDEAGVTGAALLAMAD